MKFNKNSGCVKVWITLIIGGTYKFEDVPSLLNLQEQVKLVLIDMGIMIIEESETEGSTQ